MAVKMPDVIIGATVDSMDVSRAGRSVGFSGTDSRAHVVRYGLLRWILGYSHEQALEASGRNQIQSDPGLRVTGLKVNAKIDSDLLAQIEHSPIAGLFRNRSHMIRYVLYRSDGYDHEEAIHEAYREHGGARKRRESAA